MRKLTTTERTIVERLIFPETFEVIMEETSMHHGALRDDLINLVNYRFVEVINYEENEPTGTSFYDSDNINDCTFRATKIGLKTIRNYV